MNVFVFLSFVYSLDLCKMSLVGRSHFDFCVFWDCSPGDAFLKGQCGRSGAGEKIARLAERPQIVS